MHEKDKAHLSANLYSEYPEFEWFEF
jgi:hypothetical protein